MAGIFVTAYVFLAIVMFGTLFVGIVYQYYKSMFSKSGYLTLTLPVSTHELVISKIIATLIWFLAGIIISVLGFVIFGAIAGGGITLENIKINFQSIQYFLSQILTLETLKEIILLLISVSSFISSVFVVVTLVHTKYFRKRRLFWGIAIYLIGVIVFNFIFDSVGVYITNRLILTLVDMIILVVFYLGTVYFIDHKIELE